jgi:hypothetical protein
VGSDFELAQLECGKCHGVKFKCIEPYSLAPNPTAAFAPPPAGTGRDVHCKLMICDRPHRALFGSR